MFLPQKYNQVYCSVKCRDENNRQQVRKWVEKNRPKQDWKYEKVSCPICKLQFNRKVKNQIYCSRECYKKIIDYKFIQENRNKDEFKKAWNSSSNLRFLRKRVDIFDRDNFRCRYCGRSPLTDTKVILHIDHKIPKKHGGTDDIDNLITSCMDCNLGKSDRLLTLWNNYKKTSKLA